MSSYTKFNAKMSIQYDDDASVILGDDYWRIMETFQYDIGSEGSGKYAVVNKCFLTDGASIPRPVRWLIPRLGKHGQAAALHDKLCETYTIFQMVDGKETEVKVTRKEIDHIFYEALKVSKVNPIISGLIRAGVDSYRIVTRPSKPNVKKEKRRLEQQCSLGQRA
ncbi:DUF1353 domain-containing protein [Pseudomonas aeruginosa]|uniref:DUF1353 domain-containing protein n=1 Tax=Pseudomonas aeruginosa TaxID=287 RepID=UPI0010C37699|nr:DUF1353 domain-containing protein [Pseudomonas aeruginosa]MBW6072635.1 DUF1353 domain-containing protein [Pseudomonas aeruginosa]QBX32152.1 putative tail assembly protein [Pseudomonas phage PA1C]